MTAAVALAEPLSPQWHEARRHGIGASEISAVMGISPWESPFSLYWRKVNGWEVEETEEMRTGRRLETVIAEWWADECDPNENLTLAPAPLLAHRERPWQLATPDRTVHLVCGDCGGLGYFGDAFDLLFRARCSSCRGTGRQAPPVAPLECKWTSRWDGWGEPETDEIPVHYRAQVLQQCDVLDAAEWHMAVLGPGGFRAFHGRRDERDLAVMREHGCRFMDRLEHKDPPSVDEHHATLETLRRVHPDMVDTQPVEVDEVIASGFLRAVEMKRKAEALKDRYEAALRDQMGDHRRAITADGRPVATRVISDVAESLRKAHRRDYLLAPRSKP